MKKLLKNCLTLLILLFLIIGIFILCKIIYKELIGEDDNVELISKIPNILIEEKKGDNILLVGIEDNNTNIQNSENEINIAESYHESNNIDTNFFYNQLSERQKAIYKGIYENKNNLKQGDYVINFDNKFEEVLSQVDGSQILGTDYQTAIEAFINDNPDIFYIDINKMFLNIETSTRFFNTTYKVYIGAKDGIKYYTNDFKDITEIEQAIKEVEKEKNKILNNLEDNDYKKIKYIHDYLINNLEYDSTYHAIGTYDIYGALVEKKCVCEGYAKAFKYLTNCAGLECELVQGTGVNTSGGVENHQWNCIKLNGLWYYVDCTWDDPIIIGGNGKATKKMMYKYFLKGSKTFENDHEILNQFSEGGKLFAYPSVSIKDYNI